MILFVFFSLVVFLLYLQAGLFLLFRKPVAKSNRLFAYSLFSLAWISLFFALIQLSDNVRLVYLFDRINIFGWIFLPFFLLLFMIHVSGKPSGRMSGILKYAVGALATILLIRYLVHPQSLMIYYRASSGMWYFDVNVQSFWVYIALSYNLGTSVAGFALARKFFFQSRKSQIKKIRIQSKLFFVSFTLFLILSVLGHVVLPVTSTPVLPAMVHLAAVPMAVAIFFSTILVHPQTFFRETISDIFIRRIREFVFYIDHNGLIYSVNQHCLDVLKFSISEMINKEPDYFFKPAGMVAKKMHDISMNYKTEDLFCMLRSKDGSSIPVSLRITKVYDAFRNMVGYLLIASDYRQTQALYQQRKQRKIAEQKLISRNQELENRINVRKAELISTQKTLNVEQLLQKEAEKKILIELKNKEEMMRELHHRVKNNIQMIISLINIEHGKFIVDEKSKAKYESIANRIRTISMIHDYLYDTPYLGKIDLKGFVGRVIGEFRSIIPEKSHIRFYPSFQHSFLSINEAIPCGVIIFELLGNAFQHAFSDEKQANHSGMQARIDIDVFFENHECVIHVQDNGKGMVLHNGQPKLKKIGLSLVELLVCDILKGSISFLNHKGAFIRVAFECGQKQGL